MEIQNIYRKVLNAILKAGINATSEQYMNMVLETILKSYYKEFPFLKHIKLIHINGLSISVSDKINKIKREKAEFALSNIIRSIKKPFTEEDGNPFTKEVKVLLDDNILNELKKIDIVL